MILLDDAQSTAANPSSRLYQNPLQYWSVLPSENYSHDQQALAACLNQISQAQAQGKFIVIALAYELGRHIHELAQRQTGSVSHPLLEAWSFEGFEKLSKEDVDQYIAKELNQLDSMQKIAGVMEVSESIDEKQFIADLAKISEYIRSGDSYQINHTYRITGKTYGSPLALYSRLRERQPGRFGAYLHQDSRYLLSQSPELLIERKGNTLKAMPMKGTAMSCK
ncbi:chorismate-binding protein [Polynucleobacter necessarius]|uniref:chorismate-binding protein n=1 Tax=Polynucleobacter necessarius TaxID=576610 RepID=UPI001E452634|nr:chorismate-binding protein [Polynucleobacter necessarius]